MVTKDIKVLSVEALSDFVVKIVMQAQEMVEFKAGQYLQVHMGENDKRPFSIANMPNNEGLLELHIGATPDNPYAYEVVEMAKEKKALTAEIGLGDAFLRDHDKPMVLLAGGTGYTYAKSILLTALSQTSERSISLYWGAKSFADLYDYEELMHLGSIHERFSFIPVLENPDNAWQGKKGLVHEVVKNDHPSMQNVHIYVAGRFEMAALVKKEFLAMGLDENCLFGDAFSYIK